MHLPSGPARALMHGREVCVVLSNSGRDNDLGECEENGCNFALLNSIVDIEVIGGQLWKHGSDETDLARHFHYSTTS